jgi:hypothetical protein
LIALQRPPFEDDQDAGGAWLREDNGKPNDVSTRMQDRKPQNPVPKPPLPPESFVDAVREWCRGRFWPPRAVVLAWFVWILIDLWIDPLDRGLFNWPNLWVGINLGIHEIGHVIFGPFGEFLGFLGGSLTECLAPVAAAGVFARQRDWFGIAVAAGWLSTALYDVAVYMADARLQELPLVSPFTDEPQHDWAYLFGRLGLLPAAEGIGFLAKAAASGLMIAALVFGGWLVWNMATGGSAGGGGSRE